MATPNDHGSNNGSNSSNNNNSHNNNINNNSKKEDLEAAFRLIEEGHEWKQKGKHWSASRQYAEAARILETLSRHVKNQQKKKNDDTAAITEQNRIAALYHTKALEFLQAARLSLVAALECEATTDHDEADVDMTKDPTTTSTTTTTMAATTTAVGDTTKPPPQSQMLLLADISALLQNLSDDDCQSRIELFGRLFAKNPELIWTTNNNNSSNLAAAAQQKKKSVEDEASQLEDRLLQLNSSIPRSLKTESEKIRDLNRGLRRLGLSSVDDGSTSSYSHHHKPSGAPPPFFDATPLKSESEQVADIIHQAQDEVNLQIMMAAAGSAIGPTTDGDLAEQAAKGLLPVLKPADAVHDDHDETTDHDVVDDSVSSSSAIDDDDDEAMLATDTCRSIYEKLLSVEVSLAELIALFEVDTGGDAEIEFDPSRGRHLLKDAMAKLKTVDTQWNNNNNNSRDAPVPPSS
jgi:hypothetical protein